jgi:enamine deaminase RidA (YjgF/YER057c/UK114 family)
MIRHIQPKAVPASASPFSQIVMDDTYAHFAGLVAADFPEGQAVLGDVGKETRVVLTAIRRALMTLTPWMMSTASFLNPAVIRQGPPRNPCDCFTAAGWR